MKIKFICLVLYFVGLPILAQSKDSVYFYKTYREVPVKYKLEHFGLKGKVKSFYEGTAPENGDIEKVIHEFDDKGNLIQVKNSFGNILKKYNYNSEGVLISYTTISKSKRNFEVKVNESGNVVQLTINNSDHGISTVLNEYNKNGYWTKQMHLENKSVLQEYLYENDIKLSKLIVYAENNISEIVKFSYVFFEKFVQIKLTSKYQDSETEAISYLYVDYFGNEILGFPSDESNLSETQIKAILQNFEIDKNNNWVKNQEVIRVINYY